jgi:hypothetical protein
MLKPPPGINANEKKISSKRSPGCYKSAQVANVML